MSKDIAIINDLHFGVRNDSQVLLEYQEQFLECVFFPELEKRKTRFLLILGDLMDRRKYINFQTLKRVREIFLERLKALGIQTYVIAGNHDVYYKNTNETNCLCELIGDRYENVHVFDTRAKMVELLGKRFLLQPWISNDEKAQEEARKTLRETDADVICGHFDIVGFEHRPGSYCDEGLDVSEFIKFPLVLSGHYHSKQSKGNIEYLGSPWEMTWGDYCDSKGFHFLNADTLELERVTNPFKLFHKIPYDDSHGDKKKLLSQDFEKYKNCYVKVNVIDKNKPLWYDLFIDKLLKANPADMQVSDLFEMDFEDIDEEPVTKNTLEVMEESVYGISDISDERRKAVSYLMKELYAEAIDKKGKE